MRAFQFWTKPKASDKTNLALVIGHKKITSKYRAWAKGEGQRCDRQEAWARAEDRRCVDFPAHSSWSRHEDSGWAVDEDLATDSFSESVRLGVARRR